MWPADYFATDYWATDYWATIGSEGGEPPPVVLAEDVVINGIDLSVASFELAYIQGTPACEGHIESPRRTMSRIRVANRAGDRVTDRQDDAREIVLRGVVSGADAATARANWGKVLWIIRRQSPCVIRLGIHPDRQLIAEYSGPADVAGIGPVFVQRQLPVSIPFVATDPRWHAIDETVVSGITSAGTSLPMGDADVYPVIAVEGPTGTTIVLEVDGWEGTPRASMTLTLASGLSAGEFVVVDQDRFTIHRNNTGQPGDGARLMDARTAGDWFALRGSWANPLTGQMPMGRVSDGTATYRYHQAWMV